MNKSKKIITYSFGASFEGKRSLVWFFVMMSGIFYFGSFLTIIITDDKSEPEISLWSLTIPLVVTVISIPIIVNKKGTKIDIENRKYKYYRDFFVFKIGEWKQLGAFSQLVLLDYISSRNIFYTLKLQTDYDVIVLKEFSDYKAAKKFLLENGRLLNISTVDKTRKFR